MSQVQSKLINEISKLTKIAQKDEECDKKEQALQQARFVVTLLTQELTRIKAKMKEAQERTEKLNTEKARLEETIPLEEKEIESFKQSVEKDNTLV